MKLDELKAALATPAVLPERYVAIGRDAAGKDLFVGDEVFWQGQRARLLPSEQFHRLARIETEDGQRYNVACDWLWLNDKAATTTNMR